MISVFEKQTEDDLLDLTEMDEDIKDGYEEGKSLFVQSVCCLCVV